MENILELHNGNVHVLVWWKERLMRLRDASDALCKKYYDMLHDKTVNVYEWTPFKRRMLDEIKELDKSFKKIIRQKRKATGH